MATLWHDDPRLLPSIRSAWRELSPRPMPKSLPRNRDECVAQASLPASQQLNKMMNELFSRDEWCGGEALASSCGLSISEDSFVSSPDGNTISVCVVRPECSPSSSEGLPAVIYYH